MYGMERDGEGWTGVERGGEGWKGMWMDRAMDGWSHQGGIKEVSKDVKDVCLALY